MNKTTPRPIATQRAPAIIQKLADPEWTGSRQDSIIHREFTGLTFVTGFRGTGKSTFVETGDDPENTLMFDLETKEEAAAKEQLHIGAYFPVMKEMTTAYGYGFDVQSVYDRMLQVIDKMPNDRFTTIIIDNAQELVEGAKQFIRNNHDVARKYGVIVQHLAENKYGAALSGAKYLINNLYQTAMSKVQSMIVTFQLRQAWENNQPAFNKFRTTELTTWHELSRLTAVMVNPIPQHAPIPRALVMKEAYAIKKWNRETKSFTITRRIPPAIPRATLQDVYAYLDNPWNPREPKEGETVTALEMSPFTPTFGGEQLFLLREMLKLQEKLGIKTGGEEE